MKVFVVVEDDRDVQFLVETIFSMDARFTLGRVAASAEEALESLRTTQPEIIVLDHGLSGQLTGLVPRRGSESWLRRRRSLCSQPTPISRPALTTSPLSTRVRAQK
jgi:DNA-binding response OmpR family regulator